MLVRTYAQIDPAMLVNCWRLYCEAFDELRTEAVQRHVMTQAEFYEVMQDRRVTKYAALDPDRGDILCGLATMSNDLEAFPLISPDYFAQRWPDRFQQRKIWYVGFLAVHAGCRDPGVFPRLVGEMSGLAAAAGGIIVIDVSQRVDAVYRLPHVTAQLIGKLFDGMRHERLDAQSYWAYEFPTTAAESAAIGSDSLVREVAGSMANVAGSTALPHSQP